MDSRTFWLTGFAFIGAAGGILTFARRHRNPEEDAGCGVVGWTIFFLFLWLYAGMRLI